MYTHTCVTCVGGRKLRTRFLNKIASDSYAPRPGMLPSICRTINKVCARLQRAKQCICMHACMASRQPGRAQKYCVHIYHQAYCVQACSTSRRRCRRRSRRAPFRIIESCLFIIRHILRQFNCNSICLRAACVCVLVAGRQTAAAAAATTTASYDGNPTSLQYVH